MVQLLFLIFFPKKTRTLMPLRVTSEVEAVANSCSLTCIYEGEVEEVLTPSHLSSGRRLLDEQNNEPSDEDITEINTAENSAKRWRDMNEIIERFWKKW